MPALTADLAKFVATINPAVVPARAAFGARIGMLDCVGTMIAGANEEAVKIVAQMVPTYTGNDGAPEIPGGRNLSAASRKRAYSGLMPAAFTTSGQRLNSLLMNASNCCGVPPTTSAAWVSARIIATGSPT